MVHGRGWGLGIRFSPRAVAAPFRDAKRRRARNGRRETDRETHPPEALQSGTDASPTDDGLKPEPDAKAKTPAGRWTNREKRATKRRPIR